MTAEYRALRLDEREECLDLWLTVWPGDSNRAYFERYFYGDVEWLPYYTQVAVCDGRLVSTVQICKRIVACGDFCLTMGGIANVATLQEYRGGGYNAGCLQNAIGVMEADAMDFALLFTGINTYYRKFGFVDVPRIRTTVRIRPDFKPRSTPYAVRRAVFEDMPAIRRIYASYNHDRPIAVRRTDAYWRDWMRFDPYNPPADLRVAHSRTGAVAGYLYSGRFSSATPYNADEAEVSIIELCVCASTEDEEEVVARTLLNEVIACLPNSETRMLVMETALTPAVRRVLADAASEDGIEFCEISSAMARLLHRDNLLKSVCMCSSERWRVSGSPAGKVNFETPFGLAHLDAIGDLSRVTDCEPDVNGTESAASITQSNLFGLLFGSVAPQQVTNDAATQSLLTPLFPCRNSVFWGLDGF